MPSEACKLCKWQGVRNIGHVTKIKRKCAQAVSVFQRNVCVYMRACVYECVCKSVHVCVSTWVGVPVGRQRLLEVHTGVPAHVAVLCRVPQRGAGALVRAALTPPPPPGGPAHLGEVIGSSPV